MNIPKEQKLEAYKRLSDEQKDYLASDTFTDSYNTIGKKYNLHIDKIGALGDILFATLIGLIKTSDVKSSLAVELSLDPNTLESIMKEVNEKIFVAYRALVIKGNTESNPITPKSVPVAPKPPSNYIPARPTPATQPTPTPTQNRAVIMPTPRKVLTEIENPEPVKPILPVPQPDLDRLKRGPDKPWEVTKNRIAQDFLTSKLAQPTNLPAQRTNLIENPQEQKPPQKSSSDPYREPAL